MANRYAGQKLRATYVSGTSADQRLLASMAPAAVGAVAGAEPLANANWN